MKQTQPKAEAWPFIWVQAKKNVPARKFDFSSTVFCKITPERDG